MESFNVLFDRLVLHQVRLMQLSIGYQAQAQVEIDRTEEDVEKAISKLAVYLATVGGLRAGDPAGASRVETAVQQIQAVRREGYRKAFKVLKKHMAEVASYETKFMAAVLKPHVSINVSSLQGLEEAKVMGHSLGKWQNRLLSNDVQRLTQATTIGARLGTEEAALRAALTGHSSYRGADGMTAVSRNELDTLVRTATSAFSDLARIQINLENPLLGKEVYVAILDSRTTDLCKGLHGNLYGATEGPRPPVHWYCRSIRMPALGIAKPSIPSYREWLKRISSAERTEVLGPSQAKAFQRGDHTIDRFREPRWRGINIETLARREARVFEEAGLEVPFQ